MKQQTFASLAWSSKGRTTRRERFLAEMNAVVPWERLLALIAPHYPKGAGGRPPKRPSNQGAALTTKDFAAIRRLVRTGASIANVLKRNGIEPSPERSRRTSLSTFLKAHWTMLAASDFLTVEAWTGRGLITHYLLFVISLADRAAHIAGITTRPDESCMLQIARNLADAQAGALRAKRYLIIDRDAKSSEQFRRLIRDSGTRVIRLPPMSLNLNAYAERFVHSIKDERLNRMIFIGQASLRRAVAEYVEH